jgi:hypothetical protein
MGPKPKKLDEERMDRYLNELDSVNPAKHWDEKRIMGCDVRYVKEILWRKYEIFVPNAVDDDTVGAILCIKYHPLMYLNELRTQRKKVRKNGETVKATIVVGAEDGIELRQAHSTSRDGLGAEDKPDENPTETHTETPKARGKDSIPAKKKRRMNSGQSVPTDTTSSSATDGARTRKKPKRGADDGVSNEDKSRSSPQDKTEMKEVCGESMFHVCVYTSFRKISCNYSNVEFYPPDHVVFLHLPRPN